MKRVNEKVLKVVERIMRNEAVNGINGFPPPCLGIWHQPKRPAGQSEKRNEKIVNDKKN